VLQLLFPLAKRPEPDEPDPIGDLEDRFDWVPGWHPLFDVWRAMSWIARAQVDLAKAHQGLLERQIRLARAQIWASALWAVLAALWFWIAVTGAKGLLG